ncbi:cardiolipin synthase ClsB [Verticiella sediminum]|uniref:Cardiolipin synthase B n=1 Tax=Verticiella sediminum TaxID=1247510 RepID=A0A556AS63_9BURK|nr:cardiolipin synthase ClsB [Verticiella sediminum]TSH95782.1 cardiolipin synthase ClsB [Verticiella sediminum]
MTLKWTRGNAIKLLENGEAYYPAILEAIEAARQEILIETFILFEDKVGIALKDALVRAGRRGVRVTVTVDDYGSPSFSQAFLDDLADAGVQLLVFDPRPRAFGFRTNLFRRLHRKIVVVDRAVGFIGGLNFSADHLGDYGPGAKQDYAVELRGPIVAELHHAARSTLSPAGESRHAKRFGRRRAAAAARRAADSEPPLAQAGDADVALVLRDNDRHRTDIEKQYRMAIRLAQREIIIANAYFLPGYRFLRDLRRAAKRGVKVRLILQGEPDMPWVRETSKVLYDYLLKAGVEIHEYCERPLHGKVAVVDDEWSTVGSSNLDPLSLSLNLEANVVIHDRAFSMELRDQLSQLMHRHCQLAQRSSSTLTRYWRLGLGWLMFHFLRRFPAIAGWLPAHRPALRSAQQLHHVATPVVEENEQRAT